MAPFKLVGIRNSIMKTSFPEEKKSLIAQVFIYYVFYLNNDRWTSKFFDQTLLFDNCKIQSEIREVLVG